MAYLDNFIIKRSDRLLSKRKQSPRMHIIEEVMNMLDDFRSSPWEHEGQVRSGLRSALCAIGSDWHSADDESAGLITAAFQKLGAPARPTWPQGQRDWLDVAERCSNCHKDLDDTAIARHERYCGAACAKAAIAAREYRSQARGDKLASAAYSIMLKSRTPPRVCVQCNATYHALSTNSQQKFCSMPCRNASMRKLPELICPTCGALFQLNRSKQMYCTSKCAAAYRSRKK